MKPVYLVPTTQIQLFDCGDLLCLFNSILKPYVGNHSFCLDIEMILMGELYLAIDKIDYDADISVKEYLEYLPIPTDVRNYFFNELFSLITIIIRNIEVTLKGKIIIDFDINMGYLLLANIMIPKPAPGFV